MANNTDKTDYRYVNDLRRLAYSQRKLIEQKVANGRKLDFLMQEFNRETNTLCAKANYKELTDLGLGLKVLTDQMREQIQNVE